MPVCAEPIGVAHPPQPMMQGEWNRMIKGLIVATLVIFSIWLVSDLMFTSPEVLTEPPRPGRKKGGRMQTRQPVVRANRVRQPRPPMSDLQAFRKATGRIRTLVPNSTEWFDTKPPPIADLPSVKAERDRIHKLLFDHGNRDLQSWRHNERMFEGDFEFYWNSALRLPKGGVYIEIGSFQGASSLVWGTALKAAGNNDAKIVSIDICGSSYTHIYERNMHKYGLRDMIIRICKPSSEGVKEIPDRYADFIYVDGSHKFKDVLSDIELFFPKLKETGQMAGHDANEARVLRAAHTYARNITAENRAHGLPRLTLHCCRPESRGVWHYSIGELQRAGEVKGTYRSVRESEAEAEEREEKIKEMRGMVVEDA